MDDLGFEFLLPHGFVGIADAITRIVVHSNGSEWSAPINVFENPETGEIVLKGGAPDPEKEGIFRDDARATLHDAFRRSVLFPSIETSEGRRLAVPQWYWDSGASYETLGLGRLQIRSGALEWAHGTPVMIEEGLFATWLATLPAVELPSPESDPAEEQASDEAIARDRTPETPPKGPAQTETASPEEACEEWLSLKSLEILLSKGRDDWQSEAVEQFGVSKRGFLRAWGSVRREKPGIGKAGRKPKLKR